MRLWGKGKEGGRIVILSHNVNLINDVKLQECIDMAVEEGATACVVICFQETKLLQVQPPYGYTVEHSPRTRKSSMGITTLVPLQVIVFKLIKEQFMVYVQLAAD